MTDKEDKDIQKTELAMEKSDANYPTIMKLLEWQIHEV